MMEKGTAKTVIGNGGVGYGREKKAQKESLGFESNREITRHP